jgi:diguanylate cyclase (GGDEF)-like protein
LISFDLDHFKMVNDTHGHLAGDQVLRQVAASARLAMRDGDVLVRTGGDEFLIILPGAGGGAVRAAAERMRQLVEASDVMLGGVTMRFTVSVGALSWPDTPADNVAELLAALDDALYYSKRRGRNQVTAVEPTALPPRPGRRPQRGTAAGDGNPLARAHRHRESLDGAIESVS